MIYVSYLLLCILVGVLGRSRRLGFVGFFLVSAVLTPLGGLVLLFLTAPSAATTPSK